MLKTIENLKTFFPNGINLRKKKTREQIKLSAEFIIEVLRWKRERYSRVTYKEIKPFKKGNLKKIWAFSQNTEALGLINKTL